MRRIYFPLAVPMLCSLAVNAQPANVPTPDQTLWDWDAEFLSDPTNFLNPEEEGSGYAQHVKFMDFWGPRLYPAGQVGIVNDAIEDYKTYMQGHPKSNTTYTANWTSIGPNDTPDPGDQSGEGTGQIHAIAFDPDYNGTTHRTMYCASNYGGLFKSLDGGDHWAALTDQALPFTAVSDIAVAHDTQHTIYIASGHTDTWNYGTGVYRSADGGATWTNISANINYPIGARFNIYAIEVAPNNQSLAYIATTDGIYKCANLSANNPQWTQAFSSTWITPHEEPWRGLVFEPGNDDILYASGTNVYQTSDGGANWVSLTDGNNAGLNFNDPQWLLPNPKVTRINLTTSPGAVENVYAIINTGKNGAGRTYAYTFNSNGFGSWSGGDIIQDGMGSNSTSTGWVPIAAAPDGLTVFYGSIYLDRSIDGGLSIDGGTNDGLHADKHALAFSPDGSELWVGTDGGLFKTSTYAAIDVAWTRKNNGLSAGFVYAISSDPTDAKEVIIAEQDDGINRLDPDDQDQNPWKFIYWGDGAQVLFSPTGKEAWGYDFQYHFKQYKWKNGSFGVYPSTNYTTYNPAFNDPPGTQNPVGCGAFIAYEHPPIKILEESNRMYFGWSDIWEENDIHSSPTHGSDMTKRTHIQSQFGDLPCNAQALRDAEIAQGDRMNLFQLTQAQGHSVGCVGVPSRLFRSIMPVQNPNMELPLEEVTLPSQDAAVIAVRISADDPNEVWIAYSGYQSDLKVYRSLDRGDHWVNMDPNGTLPNLPINDLILVRGMPHDATHAPAAYVATDAGVFYCHDPLNDDWQHFDMGLPNVVVSDLDINYCAGKVYASTIGRGAWASSIAEWPTEEKVLTQSATWDFHHNLVQDLHVTNGATLTVTSTVNFAPGTQLIIDPGCKVVVDGGVLTNSCGSLWDGVEVRGNADQSQSPSTNQGELLVMNNGVIENAEVAVRAFSLTGEGIGSDGAQDYATNSTGGFVHFHSGATVRNCKHGVWFKPYKNMINGTEHTNSSHFYNAIFEWNNDAVPGTTCAEMARLEGVSGIRFGTCDMHITDPHLVDKPVGIRSFDSKFTAYYSTFKWLSIGVRASDVTGMKPCYVRHCDFDRNNRGMSLNGIYNAELTDNTLLVPKGDNTFIPDPGMFYYPTPYGVYLYGCEGYELEDNTFTGVGDRGNAGLVVRHSDQMPNEFALNHFKKLYVGSLLEGNNRSQDNGLKFRCNLYGNEDGTEDCTYDVALTDDNAAIAQNQGDNTHPIGNRFYPDCSLGTDESDIYLDHDQLLGFNYYHHVQPFTEPDCASLPVTLVSTQQDYSVSSCPDEQSQNIVRLAHKSHFQSHGEDYAAVKALYDGQVNGGTTTYLQGLINDNNVSSFAVRNALLAASPNLNDSTLVPAIKRDVPMEPLHLVEVLLANTPLSPDAASLAKDCYVTDLYHDLLDQQQNQGIRWITLLEAEMSSHQSDAERARHDYLRQMMLQDSVGVLLDSLGLVLNDSIVPATPRERLWWLMAAGMDEEVTDWLDTPSDHGLLNEDAFVMNVAHSIAGRPDRTTSIMQENAEALQEIADREGKPPSILARNLLEHYAIDSVYEPIILPGGGKAMHLRRSDKSIESDGLRIVPNPATDRVTVLFEAGTKKSGTVLLASDSKGQLIARIMVPVGQRLLELDVRDWASGLYYLVLVDGSEDQPGTTLCISR